VAAVLLEELEALVIHLPFHLTVVTALHPILNKDVLEVVVLVVRRIMVAAAVVVQTLLQEQEQTELQPLEVTAGQVQQVP
jgi:hypothetical protein